MHTDIFEEVWAPYTLIYRELWYHLNVNVIAQGFLAQFIAQGNTFSNYASSDLGGFRDMQHTVNMYIYMRDHED